MRTALQQTHLLITGRWLLLLLVFFVPATNQTAIAQQVLAAPAAWQQKTYVHLSKSFFVSGERLWFSVYTVGAVQHRPLDLERLAFIELFNQQQQPVLQTTVPLQDGRGWGVWIVPDTLATGNYMFRAYTNAMKNGGPAEFFEAFITLVNPLKPPVWSTLEQPDSLVVQLFPEGGDLVYGLSNNTAIRCTNQYGEALEALGAVIGQRNDTIARFTTCCGGRASFNWTPQKGEQYHIAVQAGQQLQRKTPVPQPKQEGIVMGVKDAGSGKLEIAIRASAAYNNQNLVLVGEAEHRLQIRDGRASMLLDENNLPQGRFNLLLYDASGKVQSNCWWYRKPKDSLEIEVQLAQKVYPTRQEVKVELSTQPGNYTATPAHFSVSVYRIDSLQGLRADGIQDYLGGNIPAAIRNSPAALNLWLATSGLPLAQGSGKEDREQTFHIPQYEGTQILARITESNAAQPAAGITAYLSVLGKVSRFIPAVSDGAGILRFNVGNITRNRKALVSLQPNNQNHTVRLLPFFEPHPPVELLPRFRLPETWAAQLQEHSVASQVQAAFEAQPDLQGTSLPSDTTAFFGNADKNYLLDEYTRFPTLEEVLREYVPEVLVRKRENKFHYWVYNEPYRQFFDEDPLVLVDGVPIFDLNAMTAADPLKIRKLEVVTRRYSKGAEMYRGIVSFTTYAGNLEGMPLPYGAQFLEIEGSLPGQEFRPVQHQNPAASGRRIPDQRLQLFWAPSLPSDASGKASFSFFTSDVPGTYAIVVQGLTKDGKAGSEVMYFEVKK